MTNFYSELEVYLESKRKCDSFTVPGLEFPMYSSILAAGPKSMLLFLFNCKKKSSRGQKLAFNSELMIIPPHLLGEKVLGNGFSGLPVQVCLLFYMHVAGELFCV